MKSYYVYILKCIDNSYYTGITNNIERRMQEHNEGLNKTCFTYNKRPLLLVYHSVFTNPIEAIAFEKQIKGWSRKKKEALIIGDFELLKALSKNNQDKSTKSSG
jgi:putative endonuclease